MSSFIFKSRFGRILSAALFAGMFLMTTVGCSTTGQLSVSAVAYQSINTKMAQPATDISVPPSAKILVTYAIDKYGKIGVIIKNLTDEILIVDQEKSFLINTNGSSQNYYDPNTYSTSTTNYSFNTTGTSVNLGSIASAFGVRGSLGTILGGVGVSSSSTTGIATSNMVTITDQKQVNIGPHGSVALSKAFPITGVGINDVSSSIASSSMSYKESPLRFSVCISYSLDDGNSFEKLVTDFYVSSNLYAPVEQNGKVNDALRNIISAKSDLLSQPWYMIYFKNNIKSQVGDNFWAPVTNTEGKKYDNIIQGMIFDYQ